MVKRPRSPARRILSWAWIQNDRFGFLYDINNEVSNHSPALLTFDELRQKSSFLATDLETCPAPLPMMASGGDHSNRPSGGSPRHDGHQPSFRRARMDASSSQTSPSVR
jgi:hypothetical protein